MRRVQLARLLTAFALMIGAIALPISAAQAQTTPKATPKTSVTDIEDEVMCVVCGRPLSTSAGTAADDERAVIQGYVDQGLTKPEVKEQLVREFGKQVLVDDGSKIAGAAPIIAALVGAAAIAALLRRRLNADGAPDGDGATSVTGGPLPPAPPTADDEARIDAELSERA